jgi:hypothetical protein
MRIKVNDNLTEQMQGVIDAMWALSGVMGMRAAAAYNDYANSWETDVANRKQRLHASNNYKRLSELLEAQAAFYQQLLDTAEKE